MGGGGEGHEAYGGASDPSGVRGNGRGCEDYGVAENPGGDSQGVGGGVESSQGIDNPGVDALPRGDKNLQVATKGDGVTGEDGRGQGRDGTPPTTQAIRESGANGGNDGMARGLRMVVPPRPRDTLADDDIAGTLMRKSDGTNSARPKYGMQPAYWRCRSRKGAEPTRGSE